MRLVPYQTPFLVKLSVKHNEEIGRVAWPILGHAAVGGV